MIGSKNIIRMSINPPEHDHTYWAKEVAQYNTHKERMQFLLDKGFEERRAETIVHLATYWLPERMWNLSNRLLNAAYRDLPNDTCRTMFAIGIKQKRKEKGLL